MTSHPVRLGQRDKGRLRELVEYYNEIGGTSDGLPAVTGGHVIRIAINALWAEKCGLSDADRRELEQS